MKKRWLRIFSTTLFVSVLMIQAGEDERLKENIQEETASPEEQNLKGETDETEQKTAESGEEINYDTETEEHLLLAVEEMDKTDIQQEETQEIQANYEMDWDGADIEELDMVPMGMDISYPYFRLGMSENIEFLGHIDTLIYQDVEEHCDEELQYYELNYEITYLGTDYISILYKGMRVPPESAHPTSIAWGTTINMRTGEMVPVDEVIGMSELKDKLEQKGDMDQFGFAKNCYEQYMNFNIDAKDEKHYHDYYLKQDKIGILFGVSHSIGDYIIVEFER